MAASKVARPHLPQRDIPELADEAPIIMTCEVHSLNGLRPETEPGGVVIVQLGQAGWSCQQLPHSCLPVVCTGGTLGGPSVPLHNPQGTMDCSM